MVRVAYGLWYSIDGTAEFRDEDGRVEAEIVAYGDEDGLEGRGTREAEDGAEGSLSPFKRKPLASLA